MVSWGMRKKLSAEERFWAKVNKNGPMHPTRPWLGRCHEWTGAVRGSGYGGLQVDSKNWDAHKFLFHIKCGGTFDFVALMHSCDNKICVNLKHIDVGTQADNMADMAKRGRHRTGVLSMEIAREVRRKVLVEKTETRMSMARKLGVSMTAIRDICSGKTYRE